MVVIGTLAVLVLATFAFLSIEIVDAGNIGVPVTFGHVENYRLDEGIHIVNPFTSFHELSIRTQTYTMAGAGEEGKIDGSVNVLSKDQLAVTMDVSVMFHLNGLHSNNVYRFFGEEYANGIVHPLVRTAVRDAAAEFRAIQLIDERSALQARMEKLIANSLSSTLRSRKINQNAVMIDNILVRNIDLPNSLEESIANVQRQTQQTAQRQQALQTARAEAERQKMEAEGNASARLIRARAEAESNRIVTQSLTPEILHLRQIEAVNQILQNPGTRLVIVPSGTGTNLLLPGNFMETSAPARN